MKDILTAQQAAELIGVTKQSVLAWYRRGWLASVAATGRPRFMRGAVVAMVAGVCPVCGSGFRRVNQRQVHCCGECRKKAHRLRG